MIMRRRGRHTSPRIQIPAAKYPLGDFAGWSTPSTNSKGMSCQIQERERERERERVHVCACVHACISVCVYIRGQLLFQHTAKMRVNTCKCVTAHIFGGNVCLARYQPVIVIAGALFVVFTTLLTSHTTACCLPCPLSACNS